MSQLVERRTLTTATPAIRTALSRALIYAVALVLAAIIIVPLVYVVLGGFRTTGQIAAQPVALPQPWILRNYTDVLVSGSFWLQVANSTIIAVIATAVVVSFGALAAFPLARYDFRGREVLYTLFTLGLLFPIGVAILPLYLMLRDLNLVDTPLAVALPEAAFGLPVTIVILRPFMRTIPAELEDAAVIDGCSRFRFFWRILLPLSGPALTTVSILAFVGSWNAFLLPLLVLGSQSSWTLPIGVTNFSSQYTQDTARILAFTALSMLPALAFFVLAERRIVGGLSGAVKG
jgi:raffinose/stachyose/melibiose transport system permease protein